MAAVIADKNITYENYESVKMLQVWEWETDRQTDRDDELGNRTAIIDPYLRCVSIFRATLNTSSLPRRSDQQQ